MKFGHGTLSFSFHPAAKQNHNPSAKTVRWATLIIFAVTLFSPPGTRANTPQSVSDVAITPSDISFGDVPIGATSSQTVKVHNNLSVTTALSPFSVLGGGFQLANLPSSLLVPPGESITFNIVFAPTATEKYAGSVYLVAGRIQAYSISISGTGVPRVLSLSASASSLEFGDETLGTKKSSPITVKNSGNVKVTISSVAVAGAGFGESGIANGTVLQPGQSTTLDGTFAPSSVGTFIGKITLASNATTSPTINLSGTGVSPLPPTSYSVSLKWNSVSEAKGYFVYRSTTQEGPYTALNSSSIASTEYNDSTVSVGQTYYYVVTSVNSDYAQSSRSNQAAAFVP